MIFILLALPLFAAGGQSASAPAAGSAGAAPSLAGKTVYINVPHRVGASTDIIGRIFQPYFEKESGATVIIENLEGGGGNKAHSTTYRARPDGNTLEITPFPSAILGELTKDGDFKTMEYSYISNITGNDYNAIFVPYDSPYQTLVDLINAAKTNVLNCAGSGIGTNGHMALILLEKSAGVKFNYVSFDGGPQAATAVAGGHTHMGVANAVSLPELNDQKRIRILGIIGANRLSAFPDVPTAKELGYENAVMDPCVGLIGPPGMDKTLIDYIDGITRRVCQDPEFQAQMAKNAATIVYLGPSDFWALAQKIHEQAVVVAPEIAAMAN